MEAIEEKFGSEVDYAQLVKLFGDFCQHDSEGKYSPGSLRRSGRRHHGRAPKGLQQILLRAAAFSSGPELYASDREALNYIKEHEKRGGESHQLALHPELAAITYFCMLLPLLQKRIWTFSARHSRIDREIERAFYSFRGYRRRGVELN
jgi:hypothetical protein